MRAATRAYMLATALLVAVVGAGLILREWDVPRVLFVHLPSAAVTFLACGLVFVASTGELVQRKDWWDRLAGAGGVVAAGACTVLLATGMIWGKLAWGEWWTWSPRLTFSLILWGLYTGFVGLRPLLPAAHRARASCVYGILAFLDVPLVYMSTKLLPDVHPDSMEMSAAVTRMLVLSLVAGTMVGAACVLWLMARRAADRHPTDPGTGAAPIGRPPMIRNVLS